MVDIIKRAEMLAHFDPLFKQFFFSDHMASPREFTHTLSIHMMNTFRYQLSRVTGLEGVQMPPDPIQLYNVKDQCNRIADALVQAYLRPGV